ncbi:hypothetical protein JY651_07815 [Pyxidicoccus parkwayensis]|uniref:Uncharacterized protein n=1 Tax=Pyxidicoccus parkwayensis TaxID=2813578 RepID=A0ABX7P314_9BACT|nr:hypothetical protein [Pyxidicoccus parkwaysis]QSQ24836.1 hypothetical protein JY651_07815 [Pyxidicoccus parkwaysis]
MSFSLLTTPTMRRTAVAHLVSTTPLAEVGLLRVRLRREAELMEPGGCAVCWAPRTKGQQTKEVRGLPVETCEDPRCVDLVQALRDREAELHQHAKAGLLAAEVPLP